MRNGHAGKNADVPTSVRVEVDQLGAGAPVPDAPQSEPHGSRLGFVVAAVVLAAIVGVMLFVLAPESGEAADGSPITAPTTETPTTSTSSSTLPTTTLADQSEPFISLDDLRSVETDLFLYVNVEVDLGWVAMAEQFTDDDVGVSLFRSIDGLNWQPIASDLSDLGTLIGLAIVDDEYVVAIDTENSWSRGFDSLDNTFDVHFYESADGDQWEPSARYRSVSGSGFVFPVQIADEAVAVPARRIVENPNYDQLIDYLDGVVEPAVASTACTATTRQTDEGLVASLIDCDGETIVEIDRASAPELFEFRDAIDQCVESLRNEALWNQQVEIVSADGDSQFVNSASRSLGFGWFDGTTYLAPIEDIFGLDTECFGPATTAERKALVRWTADDGQDVLVLPEPLGYVSGFPNSIVETEDGSVLMTGRSGVMSASPPFDDWELISFPDASQAFSLVWSIAHDGSLVMGQDSNRWVFLDPDGTVLRDMQVGSSDWATVILSTDDAAIVQVDTSTGPKLVEVPLEADG